MPENQSDGKCAFGQRWWGWRFRLLSTSELPRGFDWKIGSRIQQRCTHARIQRQRVCLGYNVTVAGGNQSVVYRPRLWGAVDQRPCPPHTLLPPPPTRLRPPDAHRIHSHSMKDRQNVVIEKKRSVRV